MKRILVPIVLCTLLACHGSNQSSDSSSCNVAAPNSNDSGFIPIDTANKMIKSYLASINSSSNDTDIRSLSINANNLRSVLMDPQGLNITHLKLMFGHTLSYINNGGENQPCGYKSGALTIIMAGYDDSGNYIYVPAGMVMDNTKPCPAMCPAGQAGEDLLPL